MLQHLHTRILRLLPQDRRTDRTTLGLLEAWVSIVGNIALFAFKLLAGFGLNSLSLTAEAFHSLADVLTSAVVVVGFRAAAKPADREHPHGHGRFELVAAFAIAFLLLLSAWELGQESFRRLLRPQQVRWSLPVFLLLLASAAFKEWMASFGAFLGRLTASAAVEADAWHHRSDAVATVLVALGLLVARADLHRADGLLGLGVCLLIAWTAVRLLKETTDALVGRAPHPSFLARLHDKASSVPGVLAVHDITVHDYQNRKEISLHIEVPAGLSAAHAHDIARRVEELLRHGTDDGVTVHIDPRDADENGLSPDDASDRS